MEYPRQVLHCWLLGLLASFPRVLAWGKDGHYATCKIAEGLLAEDAALAVKKLLPEYANGDLASLCSWPDEIRHFHQWRWSSPLHYIDTPDFKCNYEYSRDCHDFTGNEGRCVAGAIYNYTAQLTTFADPASEGKYNLTEALLFLSHFMGDIHQPLHVGFTGDEGGNTIIVRWFKRKSNLHHIWDNMIIETAIKDYYDSDLLLMIQSMERNITEDWSADIASWRNCNFNQMVCPNPYASESIKLACKFAYRNATPGTTLRATQKKEKKRRCSILGWVIKIGIGYFFDKTIISRSPLFLIIVILLYHTWDFCCYTSQ
ncbi:endonuclease 4-like isoform X1 [Amborella trichopoda]|uniref:endonuclease 4-like isoform X1 n=1 Tax=Amborella trichopoda TaxID=13333 RepID=UPI0009BCC40D|nr:endonuclease 4-like isoform X1 [Amborella trichopoda]|eukprot:XP_020521110.1 endonuclease 4-like isoform X1 [Amborella trichopoda]